MSEYYYYEEEYGEKEPSGSMEQELVEALDAGVQHSVNKALVRATEPLKRHLCHTPNSRAGSPLQAPVRSRGGQEGHQPSLGRLCQIS